MALSPSQARSLVVIPKLLAIPSLIGSLFIVVDFVARWKSVGSRSMSTSTSTSTNANNNGRPKSSKISPYNRLIASMAIIDIFTSFSYFLGTWPIPKESGAMHAIGSERTCTIQAFVIQSGMAIPFYNMSLALYYLFVVAFRWKERDFARKVEPWMHAIAVSVGLGTSIASVKMDLFHNSNLWCWIAPNPSPQAPDNNFNIYRWAFFYGPLWVCILGVAVAMTILYVSVKSIEKKAQKWHGGDKGLGKQVAGQAFFYVGAFLITWSFATASRITQAVTGAIPYPLLALFVMTLPGQGLWNFLVFFRPRFKLWRKNHPNLSLFGIGLAIIRDSMIKLGCRAAVSETDDEEQQDRVETPTTEVAEPQRRLRLTDDEINFAENPAVLLSRLVRQGGTRTLYTESVTHTSSVYASESPEDHDHSKYESAEPVMPKSDHKWTIGTVFFPGSRAASVPNFKSTSNRHDDDQLCYHANANPSVQRRASEDIFSHEPPRGMNFRHNPTPRPDESVIHSLRLSISFRALL